MSELACSLGLRIREVMSLMWEDFDSVAKTGSIHRSAGNGNVADEKTEASREVIPFERGIRQLHSEVAKNCDTFRGRVDFPKRCDRQASSCRHFALPPSCAIGNQGWSGKVQVALKWSGRRDSNPRPSAPKADALPDCATPRRMFRLYREMVLMLSFNDRGAGVASRANRATASGPARQPERPG